MWKLAFASALLVAGVCLAQSRPTSGPSTGARRRACRG